MQTGRNENRVCKHSIYLSDSFIYQYFSSLLYLQSASKIYKRILWVYRMPLYVNRITKSIMLTSLHLSNAQ